MIKVVASNPRQFTKAHEEDGGYDILSSEEVVINARSRALVSTGLKLAIPRGYVGIIKARSGLASKHSIDVSAGVIDCGYTGEVKVLLVNNSNEGYKVNLGDKIAQMLVIPIHQGWIKRVESLDETDRGDNGFNSTGY